MIEVSNLTKRYGTRNAVSDISFSVKKGEILGFLGPNGAGKSTTMKILTGFQSATTGTVKVCGFDVLDQSLQVRKNVGYLPENPPVYPELLVSEYLDFVAELRGVSKAERAKKVASAIERCQLGDVRNRLIANLSKGYKQRVGIAQAIVHDPAVVILDEPTIGLDPKQVADARELIRSMRTEKTVIYSTHILSEVAATCDRIVIIHQGKVVAQESLTGIDTGLMKTEVVVQRADERLMAALKAVNGVKSVQLSEGAAGRVVIESEAKDEVVAEISKTVVTLGSGLLRVAPMKQTLEDYYLTLMGGRR